MVPAGGTGGVPLYPKTSEGGAGGIAAHAKPDPPLKEDAGQSKDPLFSQRGAGSCAPAGGQGVSPCTLKRRRAERAGQRRTPKPALPSRRAQAKTKPPSVPANLLLQNTNKCAIMPQEVGSRPTPLPRSLPHTGALGTHGGPLRREALGGASPAAAVAATSPALGQGAPGGCSPSPATLRGSPAPEPTPLQDELLEAAPLRDASGTAGHGCGAVSHSSGMARHGFGMARHGYDTAPCLKTPKFG